ncbi:hypothetical protein F0562_024808 [Nyssa sinensis]|uniref:Uncharacterized protein n=1 Tax=Nyssa sinensis TaxID=561372 RepID=A0A5J5BCC6_9ASTE|nr:hypothetical protein F0562_024808 [Nyssa sinensis]
MSRSDLVNQTITGREFSHKEADTNDEMAEMLFPKRRCCFCIPCFGSNRSPTVGLNWWHRMRTAEGKDRWWGRGINGLKKLREWSEIVAGPRWKTFIRRFNRNKSGGVRHGRFQYDPLSYALNFDQGPGQNDNSENDDYEFRNFSSRFASIPISTKSLSMDLGKDGPSFT